MNNIPHLFAPRLRPKTAASLLGGLIDLGTGAAKGALKNTAKAAPKRITSQAVPRRIADSSSKAVQTPPVGFVGGGKASTPSAGGVVDGQVVGKISVPPKLKNPPQPNKGLSNYDMPNARPGGGAAGSAGATRGSAGSAGSPPPFPGGAAGAAAGGATGGAAGAAAGAAKETWREQLNRVGDDILSGRAAKPYIDKAKDALKHVTPGTAMGAGGLYLGYTANQAAQQNQQMIGQAYDQLNGSINNVGELAANGMLYSQGAYDRLNGGQDGSVTSAPPSAFGGSGPSQPFLNTLQMMMDRGGESAANAQQMWVRYLNEQKNRVSEAEAQGRNAALLRPVTAALKKK